MGKTNTKSILAVALALVLCVVFMFACGQKKEKRNENLNADANVIEQVAEGGVLYLKVNPEIEVSYDAAGKVVKVEGRNDDGRKILETYAGYEGKECRQVISELVNAIGSAGYLVEEIEGQNRQITIEIKQGSKLPSETFMDDIVVDVRNCVSQNKWQSAIGIQGESDYGITDYVDTDYGVGNDGVTDYDDTDYGPNNDGVTDYNDTDYGPNNDGVTDYDDTDYGPNNDGVTDYNDTDYGPNNDGVTDYNDTDYGPNNDGVTDYNDSNYGGNSNYGNSNYGNSNYGNSNYDSDSGYDD